MSLYSAQMAIDEMFNQVRWAEKELISGDKGKDVKDLKVGFEHVQVRTEGTEDLGIGR